MYLMLDGDRVRRLLLLDIHGTMQPHVDVPTMSMQPALENREVLASSPPPPHTHI